MKKHISAITGSEQIIIENQHLTDEETKKILTPFAFKIDNTLFGIALAAPWRRGIALVIDLLLIALLSDTPGEVLALVIAITFYRLGDKKRAEQMGQTKGRKKRGFMRFTGALIILVILANALPDLINDISDAEKTPLALKANDQLVLNNEDITVKESLVFTGLIVTSIAKVSQSDCEYLSCWEDELSPLMTDFSKLDLPEHIARDGLQSMTEDTKLSIVEQKLLFNKLFATYQQSKAKSINPIKSALKSTLKRESIEQPVKTTLKEDKTSVYSVMEWTKGIIDDLGLSFGWAAFYFTVFTSLWKGQTPGKKMVGIKVIQLDGTLLSLWDSFGRYGGYGAGIATGLLGFVQIYWDPNRQAIHDKISATVVIDIKKSEQSKHLEGFTTD